MTGTGLRRPHARERRLAAGVSEGLGCGQGTARTAELPDSAPGFIEAAHQGVIPGRGPGASGGRVSGRCTVWPKPTSAEERAGAGHGDCWLVGPLAMPRGQREREPVAGGVAHTRTRRHSAHRGGGQFSAESPSAGRHFLSGEDWCAVRVSGCGRLHTFRGELSLPAPGVPLGGQRLAPVRHWLPGPSLADSTARGAPAAAGATHCQRSLAHSVAAFLTGVPAVP